MDRLQFDVVIAGGGFAGVYAAQSLTRRLGRNSQSRVALIADRNFMVFQPMLAEVVGSSISPRHVVNPIRRLCPGATVLRGAITGIDLPGGRISVQAGDYAGDVSFAFQHLVIALGSVVDLSRVPGMPEHAYLLKNVGDALRLRATIIDRFEEANLASKPAVLARLLTFVVVGGGYSGVETAGQINDLGREILSFYPRLPLAAFRVALIHSGPHLLPEISESLGSYCEENLRSRGVELILGARVTAMTASKVLCSNGAAVESHTVVSTVGNAPHPLLAALCKENAFDCAHGRILTDETMRVRGQTQVWAAGDCAAVPMPQRSAASPPEPRAFCPPTAQFAMRQGRLLGENIALVLGQRSPRPFAFTGLGELASIGHHAAVAEILGMKFSGFFAWWLWRTIYLTKLPGLERKLRVMIDWTLDLFFARDITLFQTKPTQVLLEMHLEKGDILFHAGEPTFSFYIVKNGLINLQYPNGELSRAVGPGDHFGERTLLGDRTWRFTAVAAERSTLVALGAKVFDTITLADTSIRELLVKTARTLPAENPRRDGLRPDSV